MSFIFDLFCCQKKAHSTQITSHKTMQPAQKPVLIDNATTNPSLEIKSYETIDSFVNYGFNIYKSDHCHSKHNYKGLRKLGEGKFGNVYLMGQYDNDQNEIKKLVAVKVIKKNLGISNSKLKKFIAGEKNVSKELQGSPFVIYFISTFQNTSSGEKFFVYQYASGGNVFSLLGNRYQQKSLMYKKNLEVNARFITACVVQGLRSLHSKNYIYRDLKPENLLIIGNDAHAKQNEKGYVKLADFGLVWKLEGENAYVKQYAGTPAYLAPQAAARKRYNRSIDLWALGVLIYELFTGEIPFTKDQLCPSKFQTYAKDLRTNNNFASKKIPTSACNLILDLLEFDPNKRLGYNNLDEIKAHQFFQGFNWQSFEKMQMRSPLKKIVTFYPDHSQMLINSESEDSQFDDNVYLQSNFTQLSEDSES